MDKFDEVASRLMEIADEIPFTPPDVEVDSPEGESWFPLVVSSIQYSFFLDKFYSQKIFKRRISLCRASSSAVRNQQLKNMTHLSVSVVVLRVYDPK